MISVASNNNGMMCRRRRRRRLQVERAQAVRQRQPVPAGVDAAAVYLSASRCSVRVRRRTEGSAWELRPGTTSAAQTRSQSSAGASCVVVLIASEGAQRAWVPYECQVVLGRSCTARSRRLRQAKRLRYHGSELHRCHSPLMGDSAALVEAAAGGGSGRQTLHLSITFPWARLQAFPSAAQTIDCAGRCCVQASRRIMLVVVIAKPAAGHGRSATYLQALKRLHRLVSSTCTRFLIIIHWDGYRACAVRSVCRQGIGE